MVLQSLIISYNDIGSEGAIAIAKGIQVCCKTTNCLISTLCHNRRKEPIKNS